MEAIPALVEHWKQDKFTCPESGTGNRRGAAHHSKTSLDRIDGSQLHLPAQVINVISSSLDFPLYLQCKQAVEGHDD